MMRAALTRSLLLATACCNALAAPVQGGDADRGRDAVRRYGCSACHTIPGIANQGSNVGPPLAKMARRAYIGGMLPNTPEQMVRWLRNPPAINARTAMPDLGVTAVDAADIAAFLYTLD